MWRDGRIQRTFRCRLQQKPGSLGRLLTAIGDQGGHDRGDPLRPPGGPCGLHKAVAQAVARTALAQGLNRDDLTRTLD